MQPCELRSVIENALYHLILTSSTSVPSDVKQKLADCQEQERAKPIPSSLLKLMLTNINYGQEHQIPICQDTGHINFFIQLGQNFPLISDFRSEILKILAQLTSEAKIRPNTVDPFTDRNMTNNGGVNSPPIYVEIIPNSTDLVITTLNKGGGSENMCHLFMLSASQGKERIIPTIKQAIAEAGGKPCPPIIVGLGIGGDSVKAMYLAKKALLRPLGSSHSRPEIADLERDLLNELNTLDVGVMGLGGKATCLAVHAEYAMRHPATFPLGLVVECYSHRTISVKITPQGKITFGKLDSNYIFAPMEVKMQ